MRLYHYTCLFHLPPILQEGLKDGEIPVSATESAVGPNLTGSLNSLLQHWAVGLLDKTKVRITVEVDEADPKLKKWKSLVKGSRQWIKALDPYGQGKFWWVYFGIIPPSSFRTIELAAENGTYRVIEGEDLRDLIDIIVEEREKFILSETPHPVYPDRKVVSCHLREGHNGSWLFDGLVSAAVPSDAG